MPSAGSAAPFLETAGLFLRPGTGGTVSFKYDPFGRRIYKSSSTGTTIYAYDGDNIVEQLNSSGTATARYTQGLGIDEPMEVYEGGKSYYYHADGLGSIVALTKSTGTAANTYFGYNTLGGVPSPSETVANPFRYTARDYDSETGLHYYRARYYDSLFGRFLSEDPLHFNGGSFNFYPYVANNPPNYSDPDGLRIIVVGDQDCYWKAKFYLTALSPTARDIFAKADASPKTIEVHVISDPLPPPGANNVESEPSGTIDWYCHAALRCTNGGVLSPASGLAHELAHAVGPRARPLLQDRVYDTNEERRVITGPERSISRDLGEATRENHKGTSFPVIFPFDHY